MDKKEIESARSREIFKSNTMLQTSRHRFTMSQQKAILYVLSMLVPDTEQLEYIFDISDYMKICGIEKNGQAYKSIKTDLKALRDDSWFMNDSKGNETTVSWLNKVWADEAGGKVRVRLDEDLLSHMIGLKEKFKKYELYQILALSSSYAITLYEHFKSRQNLGQWIVDVEHFKHLLMIDDIPSYKNWAEVKRKIIDVALKQINEYTDLKVTYTDNGKRGRKATKVCFVINTKEPMDRYLAKLHVDETLDAAIDDDEEKNTQEFYDFIKSNTSVYKPPKRKKK